MSESDEVARRAAHDAARMLDRRGLRELVALARRVGPEARLRPNPHIVPQVQEPASEGCTLGQRDWSPQRRAALRRVDDRDSG